MPRTLFDQELERLGRDLSAMGRLVDKIMQGTIKCLKTMDIGLARTIFPRDAEINSMEKNIEQNCMNLLALQQPLAGDLRIITSTLKIITDMERISDQCADICEILSTVPRIASLTPSSQMLKMFEKAREMTAGALDAYIRRDAEAARAVCLADDEIDSLFSSAVPENVDFMFIAKYIERMGDHATNIAEWAIFVQTGVHPNLNDTAAPEE